MPDSALVAALLAGLLGGVHCIAMCGAYITLAQRDAGQAVEPLRSAGDIARGLVAAHAGRIGAYAFVGAAFGALGGTAYAAAWIGAQRGLYLVANLFLLVVAWSLVRGGGAPGFAERAGLAVHRRVAPALARTIGGSTLASRVGLGVLWGLTPCALVYGLLPLALLSGGAWQGALILVVFGIATLPNVLAAGWMVGRAKRRLDHRYLRWAAAVIVAAFAVVGLWRALGPVERLADGPYCLVR
ncbi:MAG: sulfite exporter TauE/SafE family protein [Burkholderiales bacterium]